MATGIGCQGRSEVRRIILFLALWTLSCAAGKPRLEYGSFRSDALREEMRYGVYLPPGWDRKTPLPLVVFLHGGGDDEQCFDEHGATAELDDAIRAGRLEPFILVVPDGGRGFWTNWYDGSHRYEDYVVDDVIPRIRSRYPIRPGRESTHLLGISMGGAGAMYMTLHRPEAFASSSVLSAPLMDVDQTVAFLDGFFWQVFARVDRVFGPASRAHVERNNLYTRIRSPADLGGVRLLIAAGTEDRGGIADTTSAFHEHLVKHHVPHQYLVFRGGHRWTDWRPILPVVLCRQLSAGNACALPLHDGYTLEEVK